MTLPDPGTLDVALKFAPLIAASGIWVFGVGVLVQNWRRAAQADADRKATEGMLAALERQGKALEELIRRTSPPRPRRAG